MAIKIFNLSCASGHAFEGWFGSAADCDDQQARALLSCPVCGSTAVARLPSAPYIGGAVREPQAQSGAALQAAALPTPAQMQAALVKLARELVAGTDDVGERFAEEARRIHYKETPERGIRGIASRDEAKALEDEGINVMPLPFAHLLKEPLQ